MPLTQEQIKKYLANQGTRCPHCDSKDISQDDLAVFSNGSPNELFPTVTCESCGKTWTEQYRLETIFDPNDLDSDE